jgi:inosine/xanthosine triphosphatase
MVKIILASKNPAKRTALELVVNEIFDSDMPTQLIFEDVLSGVSSSPLTKQETYEGACNRLNSIEEKNSDADYIVSIEGGFYKQSVGGDYWHTGWVLVKNCTTQEVVEVNVVEFKLPKDLSDLIASGMHCGAALKQLSGDTNSKQTGGVIGHVTGGIIDRMETYYQPLMIAFCLAK